MHNHLSSSSLSLSLTTPATPSTPKTISSLPAELLHEILSHIPKSSLPSIRLLNHTFEAIAFPLLFRNLLNWLDYNTSHAAILALAHDAFERPSVMWSPWASEPEGPVRDEWLGIIWRLQMGTGLVGGIRMIEGALGGEGGGEGEGRGEKLTPENYARLSGREEMSEKRLRVAQNRYLMHRSYSDGKLREGRGGEVVESRDLWEEKEL